MKRLTLGVFAHVDAGKTTFCEQILYKTQVIRALGRVDLKSAFLDTHDLERQRGITIFSEQAHFNYLNGLYYLIDSPGHVDFSSEMVRALEIIDYAIVLIDGTQGPQSHTETILELLRDAGIPTLFFVNKLDAPLADLGSCIHQLIALDNQAVDFTQFALTAVDKCFQSDWPEALVEALAERDEGLLDLYLDGVRDLGLLPPLQEALLRRRVVPIFAGSALKDQGMDNFLEALHTLTWAQPLKEDQPISGLVYKVRYDTHNQRQTFIKLLQGTLEVRDYLGEDRITEIRRHQGPRAQAVARVVAGDVFSVIGIKALNSGDRIGVRVSGDHGPRNRDVLRPSLRSRLVYSPQVDVSTLFKCMKQLNEEDPFLDVSLTANTQDITVGIMGAIQLEVLKSVLKTRFGFDVDFSSPDVIYRESIEDRTVYGCGHFEPLRHYAEVHLELAPGTLGSGITFNNGCHPEDLSDEYISQVRHKLLETRLAGILTGATLTDLEVTLVTGRAHKEHTSPGDFGQATIRALRHGLEQARAILLEPLYQLTITVPSALVGRVIADLTALSGVELEVVSGGDTAKIHGFVPVATFGDYPAQLASLSGGQGRMRLKAGGYRPCHNTKAVIEKIGYQKARDTDFPSSSIFCSKGKGFTVPWEDALSHMHCPVGIKYKASVK